MPGVDPNSLLEITGTIYGLANSPRVWYNALRQKMEQLGWQVHSLDPAFFLYRVQGNMVALLAAHVDDIVLVADPQHEGGLIDNLKASV